MTLPPSPLRAYRLPAVSYAVPHPEHCNERVHGNDALYIAVAVGTPVFVWLIVCHRDSVERRRERDIVGESHTACKRYESE